VDTSYHIKVDIRANLTIPGVERIQARLKKKNFGHVDRMDKHCLPNAVLYGRVEGSRDRGRPSVDLTMLQKTAIITDEAFCRGYIPSH